jgi:signal transduction histidine kinase
MDVNRIAQVFKNLLGNAIKFTDHGAIRVTQWLDGDQVCIAVADTGEGIPEAQLPHIFDKFYRVENVVHTREGTGLGLALVRSILERHGATVEVESQLGEGSTFTVRMPRAADPEAAGVEANPHR